MVETLDTLIIGGGQAGLSLSYYLTQQGRQHVILERASHLADPWRNQRWDSFTLVSPNWQIRLPGFEYQGSDPDGFLPRLAVVEMIERYAASFGAPLRFNVQAIAVDASKTGYLVQTSNGDYQAANVVIATGLMQTPRLPQFTAQLSPAIRQLYSGEYRNPDALPPGAVLVVGSAQSGCQIAEELYQGGRKVYLCVGASSGRAPRRYRGKDIFRWLVLIGFFDRTADKLPSPRARFAGNPHVSGKGGGHPLNLHQFARDGVVLLGRLAGVQGSRLSLVPDLHENLAKADQFEVQLVKMIDEYIARTGIEAPPEILPQLLDGYEQPILTELDMDAVGITSVIWAMGYSFDFTWVHLPVLDGDGFPLTRRGVTDFPGLYFLGQHWLYTQKSGLFLGVGEDAAHVAAHIASRR